MQNLKDKVVISGASSGIGKATAYKLGKAWAKIVLGVRRENKLKAILQKNHAIRRRKRAE
ncbi:SDR family NAD(P)-dependent oxidoreductase [Ornithobacterium rhinotracheale]|uniref:SDR family NAD(P)-dependent oxidoreductase n=1 Tax=Ornithobacterium rhinotracheale TaxID=28251 RepID=A0A3R5XVQ9_ORNRH|nr:SDR family NAD(P)-dependent oxidoreductase [Ornithobacterium rhinotracheale]